MTTNTELTQALNTMGDALREAIRKETQHRCDVYTDGEWFTDKIKYALCDLLLGEDVESCDGMCSEDFVALLRKVLIPDA